MQVEAVKEGRRLLELLIGGLLHVVAPERRRARALDEPLLVLERARQHRDGAPRHRGAALGGLGQRAAHALGQVGEALVCALPAEPHELHLILGGGALVRLDAARPDAPLAEEAPAPLLDEEAPVALSTVGWFVGLVILVAGIVAPASALFFKTFISRKKADRAN